jgi:hypothetical protein
MRDDSVFLRNLLGKRVRIVAVDEEDLPPLTSGGLQPRRSGRGFDGAAFLSLDGDCGN